MRVQKAIDWGRLGREAQKAGVFPEAAEPLIREISTLANLRVMGLMTMGPLAGDPEESRPYFVATRKIFEKIKSLNLPDIEMKYLSMGMTNSYKIALEEGANIVSMKDLVHLAEYASKYRFTK